MTGGNLLITGAASAAIADRARVGPFCCALAGRMFWLRLGLSVALAILRWHLCLARYHHHPSIPSRQLLLALTGPRNRDNRERGGEIPGCG